MISQRAAWWILCAFISGLMEWSLCYHFGQSGLGLLFLFGAGMVFLHPVGMYRQDIRNAMLSLMGSISEERWCAGWYNNLEHILWEEESSDGRALRHLANLVNGWWLFDSQSGYAKFISLRKWEAIHKRYTAKQAGYIVGQCE